jgi:hypothetical protein
MVPHSVERSAKSGRQLFGGEGFGLLQLKEQIGAKLGMAAGW